MSLKITKAFEPIEVRTIITCIYAQPGIGRTTLGYSAAAPLLLDFDQAAHRAKNRGDTVLIQSWADVEKMEQADFAPYKTVIVDTVGRALDHLAVKIILDDSRNATRAGGLTLPGYGALKTTFVTWLNKLRSYGLDVVLLAHMDEQKDGDTTKERLDITGGSKGEVYKVSDLMGRYYMENKKRALNFSPSDVAFGKNPAQFDQFDVPHFDKLDGFLGKIIASTKDAMNKLNAEQTEVAALLAGWKAKVDAAKVPADFDALLPLGKELDERIRENAKRALVKAAKDREIVFDLKTGAFVGKEPAPVPKDSAPPTTTPPALSASGQGDGDIHQTATPDEAATKKARGKRGNKPENDNAQPELLPAVGAERTPGEEG
jgi:hypothetical protein